jgi:hypothetical protein
MHEQVTFPAVADQGEYYCDQFDHQQQAQKGVPITEIGQVSRIFGAGYTFFRIIWHKELICSSCAASIQQYPPQCVLSIAGISNHNRQIRNR